MKTLTSGGMEVFEKGALHMDVKDGKELTRSKEGCYRQKERPT